MGKLTLTQANIIIGTALSTARERRHRPIAVVVLDEGGHVRAIQREDDASMFLIDVATGKAWAAVGMGVSSRTLNERARDNPIFYGALPAAAQGRFLAQTGAVVIKDSDGRIVGAVGASGGTGDEDEAICIAGVEAAGLQHA